MYRRKYLLAALLCVLACASLLKANFVFVLPDGNTSQTVNVFDAAPLGFNGSFSGAPGRGVNVLASPDSPVNYWTVSSGGTDALITVNQNLVERFRSGAGPAGLAGAVSTDGRRFLLLSGGLRIFDAATITEILPNPPLDVGNNPIDVAVSIDSRYAFVLSTSSQRLTRVDLSTNTVSGTLRIQGQSTGVSAGPDCLIYVSARNQVVVVDPETMTTVGTIALNGLPAKIFFTPDGRRGIAVNRTVVTGTNDWIFDLRTRTVAAFHRTLFSGITPITMDDRVLVAENDRFFMTTPLVGVIYEAVFGSTVRLEVYDVGGIGEPEGVLGAAITDELPNARFLYYADATDVYRVNLSTDQLSGQPAPLTGTVSTLAFARQPSTNLVTEFIQYGDLQQVQEGDVFQPVAIRALDSQGRPVFGAPVAWATSTEGVTITSSTDSSNLDGLSKAIVDPGEFVGEVNVTATAGSGPVANFTLVVGTTGPGGGGPGGVRIIAGQGQLVQEQLRARDLEIEVQNADGVPLGNEPVSWDIVDGVPGTLNGVARTDADGRAFAQFNTSRVPPSQSWAQTVIRASTAFGFADFVITAFPERNISNNPVPQPNTELIVPALNARTITAESGSTVPGAIQVRVVAGAGAFAGQPIPNVGMTVSAASENGPQAECVGGTPLSAENGIVSCDLRVSGVGSGPLVVNLGDFRILPQINLIATPGRPAGANIIGGDGQSGDPGQILPTRLTVEIVDGAGNPLSGQSVSWQVDPQGSVTLTNVVTTTDLAGRASASATLGNTAGQAQVRVTSGAASATFTLTINVNITQFRAISGSGQSAVVNQPFPNPLVVELLDEDNQPVEGQNIGFGVTSGSANVSAGSVQTNAQGRASVNVTAGANPGNIVVTATFGGLNPVTFNLSSRLPGPALDATSFRNGASEFPGIVPGSVAKIIGAGLAPNVQNCVVPDAMAGALPFELAQVTVQFGPDSAPKFAPIYYVCNVNNQQSVAVQVPWDVAPGVTSATVTVSGGSSTVQNVQVFAVQPGVFETINPATNLPHAVVMRPDGSFVSPQNPARRGEIVCMFATGLGAINPSAATNAAGVAGQDVLATLVVGLNNAGVRVVGGSYAVNMIGIYTVYFEVPQDSSVGAARPLALAVQSGGNLIFGNGSNMAVQ